MAVVAPDDEAHWFEELADHMGPAYLSYSFTKGTAKEIDELLRRVPLPTTGANSWNGSRTRPTSSPGQECPQ